MKFFKLSYLSILTCVAVIFITCKKDIQKPKPVADFSYSFIQAGILPTDVQFTSSSSNAESYYWNFGDNTTSSTQNPNHTYKAAKTYKVKLVVSNSVGKDSIIKDITVTLDKPKPDFSFTIHNNGSLPDTVDFSNASTNASSLKWFFDDGDTSSKENPEKIYKSADTFNVKLIASNAAGSDSVTKQVVLTLNKPTANFSFTTTAQETLPVVVTFTNNSTGSEIQYQWYFGDNDTSSKKTPTHNYTTGGIYNIKLVATNAAGRDSSVQQLKISPYLQAYTSFNGTALNLYAWEGQKVMILSGKNDLNRQTMYKWLSAVDAAYNYYKTCTGREPTQYVPTYINNHTTIADVPSTCGAGCGYLGFTGVEIQNAYFDDTYQVLNQNNQFTHICFYEFGRNFWFYGNKVNYKEAGSFPIAGAFAVWMGTMEARDAIGVEGSTVNGETYEQAKARFANFINLYLADPTLNWSNTLAVNQGVPGNCNAADLFTSMCMKLKSDYGGKNFLENIWKNVSLGPDAVTTQDAVDNFFLAACSTANKNLTALFQSWRWPLSASAIATAAQYP